MHTDDRPFPIQAEGYSHPRSTIPWWLAEIAYRGYAKKFPGSAMMQSLEQLKERGGFGRQELLYLLAESDELRKFE